MARAGILFTNPEHLTKLLNLDLFGRRTLIPFTLFVDGFRSRNVRGWG
jgi:hypothetical protein